MSTVLFAGWGCEHLCVVPDPKEREAILQYCADRGIDTGLLEFDLRVSELALPNLPADAVFDLVFIDGNHGFPLPVIDWFYGAGHLREGGVVVFDDLELPHVSHWLEWFLDKDPRWERLERTVKWSAYRRLSSGPLGELQDRQPFVKLPASTQLRNDVRKIASRAKAKLVAVAGSANHRS